MKVFEHINELGGDGWASLRTLVLSCSKVVVWGPSAHELRRRQSYRKTLPDPAELLWYIQHGYIQVLAREWWLTDPKKRSDQAKSNWKGANWIEEFDSPILEMLNEDNKAKRDISSARVREAPEQTGFAWATKQIEERQIDCKEFIDKFNRRAFPKGYLEKIKRLTPKEAVQSLLKDARNHSVAFCDSAADRNMGSPTDDRLRKLLAESVSVPEPDVSDSIAAPPSADEVLGAIDFVLHKLSRLGTPPKSQADAFYRTQLILDDKVELNSLRSWCDMTDRLATNAIEPEIEKELMSRLAKEMQYGTVYHRFIDYFKPRSPADYARIIGELIFASHEHTAPIAVGIESAVGMLRWLGWVQEEFHGPRWPFLWTEGSRSVHRRQREAFMRLR